VRRVFIPRKAVKYKRKGRATATMSLSHVVTYPTPPAPAPRGFCSFSAAESAAALAVTVAAWLWLQFGAISATYNNGEAGAFTPAPLPAWLPFVFCNALALSALCAFRFLRRDKTRMVSDLGYAALAVPAAQTALCALLALTGLLDPLYCLLFAFVPAHFFASAAATARGFWRPDSRGDLAALPLFFAWYFLVRLLFEQTQPGW